MVVVYYFNLRNTIKYNTRTQHQQTIVMQ